MLKRRYDASFHVQLRKLVDDLSPYLSARKISEILHLTHSVFSRWLSGSATPIWLARQSTLAILRELKKSCLALDNSKSRG